MTLHPFSMLRPIGILFCLLATLRAQAAPDRVVWQVDGVETATDIAGWEDGARVLLAEGSGGVAVLDTWSWTLHRATACAAGATATAVAVDDETLGASRRGFVGCSDGSVVTLEVSVDDVLTVSEGRSVAENAIVGLRASAGNLFAVESPTSGNPVVHVFDPDTFELDAFGSFPSTLGRSGVKDVEINSAALLVVHGGDDVSELDLSTGASTLPTETLPGRELLDAAVIGEFFFLTENGGGILQYQPSVNEFVILGDPEGASFAAIGGQAGSEPFLVLYEKAASEWWVYELDIAGPYVDATPFAFEGGDVGDFFVADGYVFGAGADGVHVASDKPWIEIVRLEPTGALLEGDLVEVEFTSDLDADYEIVVGGSVEADGTMVASGACEAGLAALASFTVNSAFVEGQNGLWVFADAGGARGRRKTAILVDNPPPVLTLTSDSVLFGDRQATLVLPALDIADLDSFRVWLSVTPFEPDDHETEGPAFDGPDDLANPLEFQASPGQEARYTISPLTNGTTYYLAVRTVDASGNESPMSNVVSVTPRETSSASQLAGEQGGYCGTSTGVGAFGLLLATGVLLGRRRRSALAVLPLPLLLLATTSTAALAREGDATRGNIELRYGPFNPTDPDIRAVYGQGHGVLWIEGGPRVGSLLEFDLGAGFWQDLGATVASDDGESSGEHSMITAWPFTAGVTLRLDFLKEQFLVPTGSAGFDYWLWKENWYVNPDVGGASSMKGGKAGYHYAVGANLLLDALEPSRASRLAARTGIQDSYVVAELRWQKVGQWGKSSGLLFNGRSATFGLKFDF